MNTMQEQGKRQLQGAAIFLLRNRGISWSTNYPSFNELPA